jgi:hypothetical protein
MRLVKFILFIVLLTSMVVLFYFVQQWEVEPVQVSLDDQLHFSSSADSLASHAEVDTQQIQQTSVINALLEDYEAHVENHVLLFSKSNRLVNQYKLNKIEVDQLLLADMNGDDMPECWVLGHKPSKQVEIFALEFKSGHSKRINFPTLKGSQAFGYVGGDSLYLEKTMIARQFNFAHDPYADVESGKRVCFYQYGKDQSFVLKKTIDLE